MKKLDDYLNFMDRIADYMVMDTLARYLNDFYNYQWEDDKYEWINTSGHARSIKRISRINRIII